MTQTAVPAVTAIRPAPPPTQTASAHAETLSIEGGLFTAEWLQRVAAQQAPLQADADYGVRAGFNVREEIGLAWRSAQALWRQFDAARLTPGHDPWAVTQRFATELLRQAFGFHLTAHHEPVLAAERLHPIPFSAFSGRVPVIVSPHQEARPLDSAHDRLGDNSGERVRRRSAFGLLQESLNALPQAQWGVATNGLLLRIARDNASLTRPAWVQVDLERLFAEERYADFSVLWLLLHASRFGSEAGAAADSPLEQWRTACRENGVRARDLLRGGVEQALLTLGQGFVGHPANAALREALATGTLSPQGLLRELLRLVYRQIFLLTVEERDILHPTGTEAEARMLYAEGYGLKRLRERALRRSAHDRHGDLWQGLKLVWRGLAGGETRLGLPALGGLFDTAQCPHLDAARLDNRHLLQALFHLAWLRADPQAPWTRVNWRDMGPEELGSIYESLLELVPLLSDGHRAFRFQTGAATRGNARKTTGSHYTPDTLVQELLDSTLEPVIARVLAQHPLGEDAARALLAITVLDPACGSGHFLLAAARRIAGHLARVRSHTRDLLLGGAGAGGQPSPDDYRQALRDVVTHCLYGVDLNPMALELARMALWLEAYTPEAPLGFIDHHLRLGNALLGVMDPKALLDGVPDEAYKDLTGDDKALCRDLKRRNKREREGLQRLRDNARHNLSLDAMDLALTAAPLQQLDALPDTTLADIAAKRQAWAALQQGAEADGLSLALHLYAAAFLLPKQGTEADTAVPTTQDVMNALTGQPVPPARREAALALARRVPLLHWRQAFAPVFARGGFSVVLGNPPWDMLQLDPEEFFASRDSRVGTASTMAERVRVIESQIRLDNPPLYEEFVQARDLVHRAQAFAHGSGRFPLSSFGRLNLAPMFVELALQALAPEGRAGLVAPSGIATDSFNQHLFAHIGNGRLVQLIDFENRAGIFPAVDSRMKFCLLTLGSTPEARFAFFLSQTAQLQDSRRIFTLAAQDIGLLNPNTRTCPVFRSQMDAELTKKIYRLVPVLWDEGPPERNPWNLQFMLMFMMNTDSGLFRTHSRRHELLDPVPLIEGKMVHQFDHRWATYEADGETSRDMEDADKADPASTIQPRYWVERREVDQRLSDKGWDRGWLLGFRDICRATDERTVIAHLIPKAGVGNQFPVILANAASAHIAALCGSLASLTLDFLARQKVGGTHLNFFIAKQLAVLPPDRYGPGELTFIVPRVLELTYTANDLQPFYADVVAENPAWDARSGAERGQPWRWNPLRRAQLRAELDALYARLYGLTRDELRYILDPADVMGPDYPSETFRVLKDKELRQHGEYRTRRLVLDAWDRLQAGNLR